MNLWYLSLLSQMSVKVRKGSPFGKSSDRPRGASALEARAQHVYPESESVARDAGERQPIKVQSVSFRTR